MSKTAVAFEPLAFAALAGWDQDGHLEALQTFLKSAGRVLASAHGKSGSARTRVPSAALLAVCREALSLAGQALTRVDAKAFFEARFTPHVVRHDGPPGLLTAYYEPVLDGSRTREGPFEVPIYRRPADLINLVQESERGALAHALTHARQTAQGPVPYATRADIEGGALDGQGLELLWVKDPVDAFFMHIQGSGRIRLPDGTLFRITYDGKNGHPYTSIGRYVIDAGLFPADRMSLDALKAWLKDDRERARAVMWQNESFVFFRELSGSEDGPLGVLEIPLTAGRSLAVDTAFHAIGTPVYVSAPSLTHAPGQAGGFRRLMVAQDVGSAIRGPERGDIYFGSGDEAGKLAGVTKHPGTFFVLLPKDGNPS